MAKENIRSELLAIKSASKDKMLHARNVVEWARVHKKSALHARFEWDQTKAADEYRLWQARELIQLVIVTESREPQLISLSCDRVAGGGYRDIETVIKNEELSGVMLHDAVQELSRVRVKYARIKKLTAVWRELDKVIAVQDSRGSARKAA